MLRGREQGRPGSPPPGAPARSPAPWAERPPLPAEGRGAVLKATQTYERLTEPTAAPGTGRSLLPEHLNPGTRTDFLLCLSPPCDGPPWRCRLRRSGPGSGRSGRRYQAGAAPGQPPGLGALPAAARRRGGTKLASPAPRRDERLAALLHLSCSAFSAWLQPGTPLKQGLCCSRLPQVPS